MRRQYKAASFPEDLRQKVNEMKMSCLPGAVAALALAAPVLAQTTGSATDLAAAQAQIDALKQQLERLEATVDYLKANASAEHKDAAVAAADVSTLKSASDKFTWSGDFRFRHEMVDTAATDTADDHTQQRDRIRVRFGVLAKVNDTTSVKLQLSTVNNNQDSARSRNQTLGTSWDAKSIGFDLAYADWHPGPMMNLWLGKMPQPWVKTASYFWDNDLTPEGAALKFSRGMWFGDVSYLWLNERNTLGNEGASSDATMAGVQLGIRPTFSAGTLTAAVGWFDVANVRDRIVKYSQTSTADLITGAVTTVTCTIDGAFGAGYGTGDNSFGNTTYTGPAPQVGSTTSCTRLSSDFNFFTALLQFDTTVGRYPLSLYADYLQNSGALQNTAVHKTLDTAWAVGVSFNKASAPHTWDFGVLYEENEKDSVFGQFVDSDFAGGVTDAKGWALKGNYVLATNWSFAATAFLNKRNYGGVTGSSSSYNLDYKRYQLDLNYKF
jgi:hypothetical protein